MNPHPVWAVSSYGRGPPVFGIIVNQSTGSDYVCLFISKAHLWSARNLYSHDAISDSVLDPLRKEKERREREERHKSEGRRKETEEERQIRKEKERGELEIIII